MASLFISYAREDRALVSDVVEALKNAGHTVWIDVQDIPPASLWRQEIAEAIASSQTFVLILTKAWSMSGPCRAESEHALSLNKRVIVVDCETADESLLDRRVVELHWLRLADGPISRLVAQITAAAEVDFEWVKLHTRLLMRAQEWQAANRDRARLLRGGDLRLAEESLRAAHGRAPAPTSEQAKYVMASRAAQTRALATVTASMSIIAVVALLAAWLAIVQRNEARKQSSVALSRQLSAEARVLLPQWPQRATLLAAEALALLHQVPAADVTSSEQGLREMLRNVGGRPLDGGHLGVAGLAFDDSRRLYIVGSSFSTSLRVSEHDGFYRPPRPLEGQPGPVLSWTLDDNRRVFATGDRQGTVRVWNFGENRPVQEFQRQDWIGALGFLAEGRWLVAGTTQRLGQSILAAQQKDRLQQLRLFPVLPTSGKPATLWEGPASVVGVATGAFNGLVAAATDDGMLRLWDLGKPDRAPLSWIHPRSDGARLQYATFGVDGQAGTTRRVPVVPHFKNVVMSRYERWLAAEGDGVLRLWRLDGALSPGAVIDTSANVRALAFSKNEDFLAVGLGTGEVDLIDLRDPKLSSRRLAGHEPGSLVNAVAFSENGTWLFTGGADRSVRVFRTESGEPRRPVATWRGHEAPITSLAVFATDTVASADANGQVRLWRPGFSGGSAEPWAPGNAFGVVNDRSFDKDGSRALFSTGGSVLTTALDAQAPWVMAKELAVPFAARVLVSPDGTWLFHSSSLMESVGRAWRRVSGRPQEGFEAPLQAGTVKVADFPSENRLLVGISDTEGLVCRLIDLQTRKAWVLSLGTVEPTQFDTQPASSAIKEHSPRLRNMAEARRLIAETLRYTNSVKSKANILMDDMFGRPHEPASGPMAIRHMLVASGLAVLIAHNGSVAVWSVDGQTAPVRIGNDDIPRDVSAAALSRNGRWLALGQGRGAVDLFSIEGTGRIRLVGRVFDFENRVDVLAFDELGTLLVAAGDFTERSLWIADLRGRGTKIHVLRGHDEAIDAAAISRDGTIVSSGEGRVLLWRTQAGGWSAPVHLSEPRRRLSFGNSYNVNSLAFSPDQRWLLGGSLSSEVQLWRLSPTDLLKAACAVAGRRLSADERTRYLPAGFIPTACVGAELDTGN